MALKNPAPAEVIDDKMIGLRRYSQKLMAAPEPPSGTGSAGLWRPRTRMKAQNVKSDGSRVADGEASAPLVDSAVRRAQRNGGTETAIARARRAQATIRRAVSGRRRRRAVAGSGARLVVEFMLGSLVQVRLIAPEE